MNVNILTKLSIKNNGLSDEGFESLFDNLYKSFKLTHSVYQRHKLNLELNISENLIRNNETNEKLRKLF